ncbi:hypothetical protein MB09_05235 [Aequorivita vladivostokensis]|uniref:Uncharacterized protein n=1 Tax=Aequorivita vladivostokensis TaxID=171194 RepID=A0ABR5DJA0_9FLAO|nr:hypothetical protein MB09_05235 [Aequorivita vladivostokensis]
MIFTGFRALITTFYHKKQGFFLLISVKIYFQRELYFFLICRCQCNEAATAERRNTNSIWFY